jgi:biliverdin reductase
MANHSIYPAISFPIRVGLLGTGYAAKMRAETLKADARSHLVAVSGHSPESTAQFSQTHGIKSFDSWLDVVNHPDIDLIVISTVNRDHGAMTRAALQAGKHVVVEYPLSLDVAEAEELVALAQTQRKLLHVEHIELLSGIHLAIADALPQIGTPFYARSNNLNPQHPAPLKWTYQTELFGFPLIGALSRIHRLINLFGPVHSVSCQARFWDNPKAFDFYSSCICTAQLQFANGLIADINYGKGEALWQAERSLTVHGEKGAIALNGEQGNLIQDHGNQPLRVGSRRGLFAKDTTMVLDHLERGIDLYVTPRESLYALRVADAARHSAVTHETISIL